MSSSPHPFGRATRVTINLEALRSNLAVARAVVGEARIMAAIKANGYGHGSVRMAQALGGADALGVACINEALQLREAGITAPITLLEGFFHADELPAIARNRLDTIIHHDAQLRAVERRTSASRLRVWLKVDSGMHRLGFAPERIQEAVRRLQSCPGVEITGFMTHLANADDLDDPATLQQVRRFDAAVAGLPGERAIANSAGLLGWPETHADWVRPGIMLYGVSPFLGGRAVEHDLKPVMTLHAELIAVNHTRRGEMVGYGGAWVCPEDMPVGVIAIGYGDGYPRHARQGTPVLLNGRRVPLVGRVSMDMITVDLRSQPQAKPGDPAVLWGEGLPVEEIAECAQTIPYELLCGITQRVSCEAGEIRDDVAREPGFAARRTTRHG